jgi:hypothetical protein
MSFKLGILSLVALGASSLFAQTENKPPVELGFKFGVPITDMFDASNTSLFNGNQNVPGSNYTTAFPRYILGVSGEFRMPERLHLNHFRLEVDGLYKRSGFATSSPADSFGNLGYYNTSMNVWEVPALLKTNITLGHVRPFIDFGASLRHISTIKDTENRPGLYYGIIADNAPELHNRNSFGGVAGIGITFKKGGLEFSPEVRYTRWANESFQAAGLRTNLDQGDFLLGINF